MTIYVSRSWPADQQFAAYPGQHPHSVGRGSGNYYTYPDEMWAAALDSFLSLQVAPSAVAPGVEAKYEWRRGYPEGYHLLERAFCALDDRPEEIMPDFKLARGESRRLIHITQPDMASAQAA